MADHDRDELIDLIWGDADAVESLSIEGAADAILAAGYRKSPEPEWEYGVEYEVTTHESVFTLAHSEKQARKWADESPTDTGLRRRIKAGPWEPYEEGTQ